MRLCHILAIASTATLFLSLSAFCGIRGSSSRYPTHVVNDELARLLPNRTMGILGISLPQSFSNGLTFWIQASVDLNTVRFTSVEDVENSMSIFTEIFCAI